MITFVEGILEEKTPTRIVLNVHGVGYEVLIPLCSYDRLPTQGETCRILTHDYIREDTHTLFGFTSAEEREFFLRMVGISGIGPKLALSALSGLSVREFKMAVVQSDVKRISSISGIGKKTAERIIVELKDKISEADALDAGSSAPDVRTLESRDALLALVSLGYKKDDAAKMVLAAEKKAGDGAGVEELVRSALAR
jgi:Holliday junction DNA helicase RuvA